MARYEVILRLIFQFGTLEFSIFQNWSEIVPKIAPNHPKIIPKPSQIRPQKFNFSDLFRSTTAATAVLYGKKPLSKKLRPAVFVTDS